jgi:hypothetical protein
MRRAGPQQLWLPVSDAGAVAMEVEGKNNHSLSLSQASCTHKVLSKHFKRGQFNKIFKTERKPGTQRGQGAWRLKTCI